VLLFLYVPSFLPQRRIDEGRAAPGRPTFLADFAGLQMIAAHRAHACLAWCVLSLDKFIITFRTVGAARWIIIAFIAFPITVGGRNATVVMKSIAGLRIIIKTEHLVANLAFAAFKRIRIMPCPTDVTGKAHYL
jgi:hypothetical protein